MSGCCAFVYLVSTLPMRDKCFPTFTTSHESPKGEEELNEKEDQNPQKQVVFVVFVS